MALSSGWAEPQNSFYLISCKIVSAFISHEGLPDPGTKLCPLGSPGQPAESAGLSFMRMLFCKEDGAADPPLPIQLPTRCQEEIGGTCPGFC